MNATLQITDTDAILLAAAAPSNGNINDFVVGLGATESTAIQAASARMPGLLKIRGKGGCIVAMRTAAGDAAVTAELKVRARAARVEIEAGAFSFGATTCPADGLARAGWLFAREADMDDDTGWCAGGYLRGVELLAA